MEHLCRNPFFSATRSPLLPPPSSRIFSRISDSKCCGCIKPVFLKSMVVPLCSFLEPASCFPIFEFPVLSHFPLTCSQAINFICVYSPPLVSSPPSFSSPQEFHCRALFCQFFHFPSSPPPERFPPSTASWASSSSLSLISEE